jgi:hypothetical protein
MDEPACCRAPPAAAARGGQGRAAPRRARGRGWGGPRRRPASIARAASARRGVVGPRPGRDLFNMICTLRYTSAISVLIWKPAAAAALPAAAAAPQTRDGTCDDLRTRRLSCEYNPGARLRTPPPPGRCPPHSNRLFPHVPVPPCVVPHPTRVHKQQAGCSTRHGCFDNLAAAGQTWTQHPAHSSFRGGPKQWHPWIWAPCGRAELAGLWRLCAGGSGAARDQARITHAARRRPPARLRNRAAPDSRHPPATLWVPPRAVPPLPLPPRARAVVIIYACL